MEEQPTSPRNDDPSKPHQRPPEPGLAIAVVLGVAAVVFAAAAWWPAGSDALGLGEGLMTVGVGVLVVAVPTVIAAGIFSQARLAWLKFLFVVPLAGIAVFVGFVWTAIISMERSEVGWH